VATDEQLMLEARSGSREAIEALFERYREPVWRFFRRRTADPARAEELAQDTFVALLDARSRYEPRSSFRSYLFGIAFNLLLAARRKDLRGAADPIESDPPAPGVDADTGLWVRAALQRLCPSDREVLMLREYEQLSYQEIADLQRIPLNTVRSRLFRARMALRDALENGTAGTARHR
jgi:RNA polymerase sigma-70 factor (ECF subfamily)